MATVASDSGHGGNSGNSSSGAMSVSGTANATGPGSPFDNDATLDLARRVRAAMARESIDVASGAAEGARLSPDAYKDKLAAALADAVMGWLAANGRIAVPGLRADSSALATSRTAPERIAGNGAAASPPGDDGSRPHGVHGVAMSPAAIDGHAELSEAVSFIGDPQAPAADGAAGVGKLGEMLRGWRKERLLPDVGKAVRPEIAIGRDESLDAAFLELLASRRRAVGIVRTGARPTTAAIARPGAAPVRWWRRIS